MPLRALFLDVGNTLLCEEPSRFEIYARTARRHGASIDAHEMRGRMSAAHRELPLWIEGAFRYSDPWFEAFISRIFGKDGLGLSEREVAQVTGELFERFEDADTFRLYPGATELLDRLRDAGLVLGVVSNWSARLPRVLAAMGLAERLHFILSSAIEGVEKPDPALFRIALERAGVRPDQALHAGDHPVRDFQGARDAGLHAVLVEHRGAASVSIESGRDTPAGAAEQEPYRVHSLAALGTFILERNE